MAMWRGERSSLSAWDADLGRRSSRNPLRSLGPLAFSDLDFWDNKSVFKDQKSSAWSCMGLSGSNHGSKISTSSLGTPYGQKQRGSLGMKRWSSASRLASEGASRPHSSTDGFEPRAALEESSMRRAELVQRLREVRGHLDTQTDLLKTRETQLQQSHNVSHFLDMKHKLSETVSVLEQNKELADQSCFEESCRRAELQDKVLQLELDMLKMRSNLERRTPPTSPNPKDPLRNILPVTKDEILREGQKQSEKEIKKLREALRRSKERAGDLEYEKNDALRQLQSSEKGKQEAVNQAEELNQRLSRSVQAQAELEDQLNETCSRLGQMELEKDLLSTKTQRLEDSQNDLKAKLSGALLDKDRLVQDKAELHQKVQALELQLQRENRGKQSFNEQVCELHTELSQAKSQSNRQKKDTIFMKEELLSSKELNKKLSSDLTKATERLQVTLNQLHELEADKLIQTNQIAALETERLKLIGEKEYLRKNVNDGNQDEIRELKERCCQHRELQENLKQENRNLLVKCQDLEKKVQTMEEEYNMKEEGLHCAGAGCEQEKEELRKVAAHWNDRWLDVAMTLCSTQAELEEVKKQQQENDKLTEAAKLTEHAENLQKELRKSHGEIQCILEEKTKLEAELSKVKQEAVALEMELDTCRHQEELQKNKNQPLQHRLMGSPVSLEEVDGELVRVKDELRKVWDMLKIRDTELVEQQQELQSAHSQVSQQSDEVQRLELLLAERDQKLREKDQDLKNLEIHRETEKAEAQIKIAALEQKLLGRKGLYSEEEVVSNESPEDYKSLKALLEEYSKTAEQLMKERDHALQKLHDLEPFQQGKVEKHSPPETKKPAAMVLVDPNQQRRLVTEQLKSLFREREQRGERSPVFPRRPVLLENGVPNPKNIKMSAVRKEMENLKEREENLLKATVISPHQIQTLTARLQPAGEIMLTTVPHLQNLVKGKVQQKKYPLGCKDGTFYARQVKVCDSDVEHAEESI